MMGRRRLREGRMAGFRWFPRPPGRANESGGVGGGGGGGGGAFGPARPWRTVLVTIVCLVAAGVAMPGTALAGPHTAPESAPPPAPLAQPVCPPSLAGNLLTPRNSDTEPQRDPNATTSRYSFRCGYYTIGQPWAAINLHWDEELPGGPVPPTTAVRTIPPARVEARSESARSWHTSNYSAHTDFPIDAVKATAQQLLAQAAAVAIECPGPPPTPTPPPAATPLPPPEAEDFPRTYSGIVTFVDTAIRYSLGEPREVTCEDTVEVTATLQADGLLGLSFSRTLLAIGNETDPAGGIRPRCIAQDFAGEVYYGRHDGEVVTLTPKRIPLDLTVSADAIRSRGSEGTTGTSWTITWRIKAFVLTRQGPTGGAAAGAISDKPDRPDDTGGPAEEANGATAGTKDGEAGDAKDDAGGDAATEVSTVEGEAEGGGAPVAGEADDILAAVLPPEAVAAINELLTGEASPEPPTPEAISAAVVAGLIPIALLAAANALISGAGAAAGAAAESVTALEGVPGGQRAPADEAPPGEAEAPPETPPPLLDPDGKPLIAWQPDA